jgi:hypothetical protein
MTKKEIMERLDALEAWDFELNQKEEWTDEEVETSEAIFSEMLELLKKLRESESSDEEIDAMAEKAEIVEAMEHGIALF